MANRQPLVIDTADAIVQQLQNDDTLFLDTNAVAGAVRLLMLSHDDGGAVNFEIRVGDDAARNTLIGVGAGDAVTSGTGNTCVGVDAGGSITTNLDNVCIGDEAGGALAAGSGQAVCIGRQAAQLANPGASTQMVAIGFRAGQKQTTAVRNTLLGYQAGKEITVGPANTCLGDQAGVAITTGDGNTCIGSNAGSGITTSNSNFCLGSNTGAAAGIGDSNILIGDGAGLLIESMRTIGIGRQAGRNTTGDDNVFLGYHAGNSSDSGQVDTVDNSIAIGVRAFTTASNQGVLGNSSFTEWIINGGAVINEQGLDADTRVEGDSLTHMIFCDASAATENIALVATGAPNWQSMDRGLFVGDASSAPSGNPASGHFYYSNSGVPTFRTSSGAIINLDTSSAYTPSNVSTDRSFDAATVLVGELANVVGTMIADLQARGLLG